MKLSKNNKIILSLLIWVLVFTSLFDLAQPLQAAGVWDRIRGELEVIGGEVFEEGVPSPPQAIAFRYIKVFLYFLGLIFMIMIIYGGFLWMTAAGNEEKVNKARSLLVHAAIGLAIVLSSLAISFFIFCKLIRATRGGAWWEWEC